MTPISSQGLSQPDELWASSGGYMGVRQEVRYDVQLDFFGQDAHSRASKTRTLLRTDWACEYFRRAPFTLQPLTTGTPVETDWAPGEGVYEKRITMMVSLQYNPVVTVTQDYMTNVCPGIKLAEVDSCFPPKD